jgi:ribonuclease Z
MSRATLHSPDQSVSFRFGTLDLSAFSISGLASYVTVPTFDACFDLGHCSVDASHLRNVFLTHVHQDHSLGVIRHLALRRMRDERPSRIYLPLESRAAMIDVLRAYERLEEKAPADLDSIVSGLSPGETLNLSPSRRVRVFDVVHRITSIGFTVIETHRKLKQAFQGLAGDDIRDARRRGEELYDYHDVNVLTYVGDSTIETLERHPELGESEVLFLEATHLAGTSLAVSARYGHTHLDELAALFARRPEALASPHIVLKHFSMKYDEPQIRAAVAALPAELRERVVVVV